jgi:superfamily II DNA or RNA helicase
MIASLKECMNGSDNKQDIDIKSNQYPIKIITKLWDHQQQTVNKIYNGLLQNKLGFGDASHVGSGKTLTALALLTKIHEIVINSHYSYLILLPTQQLFTTWNTELKLHTNGFDILQQQADGKLTKFNQEKQKISSIIKQNSIILTTLGRMRDHPIIHPWKIVVMYTSPQLPTGELG